MTDDDYDFSDCDDLRAELPPSVPDDINLYVKNGKIFGEDEHGEFAVKPMRGSPVPPNPDEYKYDPCGCVLKFTWDRYGEVRYCEAMSGDNFNLDFSTCKHHKGQEILMEKTYDLFEHGYFSSNYVSFSKRLAPEKFLFAVEMVGGLFEISDLDFNIEHAEREIDTSESDLIEDDAVAVELPIPQNETVSMQANELWMAALKEVMQQNMSEVVFTDGMSQETLAASTDIEGTFTDTITESAEHHLHLPLSRVAKDIKEHIKNGGVDLDDDNGGAVTFEKNDYTLDVKPSEADEGEDIRNTADKFAKQLDDGKADPIEVT
jgi:hypothetical protein